MSKNILFISEQKLKDSSMLSDNVDPKQLLPTIKAAQDRYVHPLLGSALYTRLQSDIEAGTVAGVYKTLLDEYVTDVLVWYTLAEIPMPLQFKFLNKGVLERTSEQSQTVDYETTRSLMKYCKDWAEWYAQRAINYLRVNQNIYPEYLNPGSTCDTIRPDKTQYEIGVFLGGINIHDTRSFEEKYQGNSYTPPY